MSGDSGVFTGDQQRKGSIEAPHPWVDPGVDHRKTASGSVSTFKQKGKRKLQTKENFAQEFFRVSGEGGCGTWESAPPPRLPLLVSFRFGRDATQD